MTQEDKELLLKDLCARLPYGVIVHVRYESGEPCYGKLSALDIEWFINSKIKTIKPYLRPISSMTEEERKEYCQLADSRAFDIFVNPRYELIDWLNKHHFDYRGLIEKGLALEAPEGMYK